MSLCVPRNEFLMNVSFVCAGNKFIYRNMTSVMTSNLMLLVLSYGRETRIQRGSLMPLIPPITMLQAYPAASDVCGQSFSVVMEIGEEFLFV